MNKNTEPKSKHSAGSTFSRLKSKGAVLALALGLAVTQQTAEAGRLFKYMATAAALSAAHSYAKSHRSEHSQSTQREATNDATRSGKPGDCTSQLPLGEIPSFSNPKWNEGLTQLCFQDYTVAYSDKTRTALWSAEYLTKQRIQAARGIKRENSFHEEEQLPEAARSKLNDFLHSKMDKGHLSPSRDFPTSSSQHESYSLANMIPQNSENNRHLWEGIESGTRNYAISNGSVYVITGPLFVGKNVSFLKNRVGVPTHIWKLLYDPRTKRGGVYQVENSASRSIAWYSVAEFESTSGYRFNLGNPALMDMPAPVEHFKKG